MTVAEALKLINIDQVPHTYTSFLTCHAWCFSHQGVDYRLAEWEGIKLFVMTIRPPQTIDEISLRK